jgi:phosphonate metabolism protein PhnN/1,5-bisphosphokinase (PRPP-forming)
VSDDAFMETAQGGGFALSWQAHGVRYGIPAGIDEDVRAGRLVVANVSRAIVADAKRRYAFAPVLIVDCPVEIRAERLALRGRERAEEILTRLQRTVDGFDRSVADFIIDNSGTLEAGVSGLVAALNTIAASVSLRV